MAWPLSLRAAAGWRAGSGRREETGRAVSRWGADGEAYPGAAALEDVARGLPAGEAAARLAVVRLALAAALGREGPALERERTTVAAYVRAGGCPREEAAALQGVITCALAGPGPDLARALTRAAAAALAGGCRGGAESLWRVAWAIAAPRAWHGEAAAAALDLAELARAAGDRRAVALWRQRAQRHGRRAG